MLFSKTKKLSERDALKQQLTDLQSQREAIIEASTARKLEKLAIRERELRDELFELDRLESSIKSSSQPGDEEQALWSEIRDLMDSEASTMQSIRGGIPSKFIRPDAVEHYSADLKKRRAEFNKRVEGFQSHQKFGPALINEENELEADERAFPTKVLPLCKAGEKLFKIREKRAELNAKRDALKAEREANALANA